MNTNIHIIWQGQSLKNFLMFFFVKNIAALYLINSELCPLENRDKESKGKALVAEDSRA